MGARGGTGRLGLSASLAVALSVALLSGCREPTEIIVIVDTDLVLFNDFDNIQFQLPAQFGSGSFPVGTSTILPATMGFVPGEGGRSIFDVTVTANKNVLQPAPPVVTRRVSNIPFVSGEMRAVFVSLLRQCMCEGTSCPHALDDECRDVTQPVLADFDEDNLPRLQARAP